MIDQLRSLLLSEGADGVGGVGLSSQIVLYTSFGVVRGRVYGVTSHDELQPAIDDLLAGRDIRPV